MKINPVGTFGHQLPRFGLFNAYLVRETGGPNGEPAGLTLIDTAMSAAPQILAAAQSLNAGPIRRILLTHAHGDHIGSLDALCQHSDQHLGGAVGSPPEVAIGQRESRLLPKPPKQDLSLDPAELAQAPHSKIKGSLPGATTPATHLLADGELYGSLRCIATPGHTPGHFCFIDERDGSLYAGDALVTMGGQPHISGWAPWFFPLPNFATWHRPSAKSSVERLLEISATLPIQRLAAGHGRLLEGGSNLLQSALKQAR